MSESAGKRPGTYTCSACHEEFEQGWSEEEAVAEAKETFPDLDISQAAEVCDDCYRAMVDRERESLRRGSPGLAADEGGELTARGLGNDLMLAMYQETELSAARAEASVVALDNTMLACRCDWEMKRRGPLWVCENWRPWNFWRHDVTVRTPKRRALFM